MRALVWAGAAALVVAGAVAAVVGFASAGDDAPVLFPCAPDVVELTVPPTVPAATCVRDGKNVPYSLTPSRRR